MATCKECFHCAACDMIYESCTGKSVEGLEFPNDAELCKHFIDRTKYVEVVRCKDCKHWQPSGSWAGNSEDDLQPIGGCEWANCCRKANDFCSYGERREGE